MTAKYHGRFLMKRLFPLSMVSPKGGHRAYPQGLTFFLQILVKSCVKQKMLEKRGKIVAEKAFARECLIKQAIMGKIVPYSFDIEFLYCFLK